MKNFLVRKINPLNEIEELYQFIKRHHLNYPNYFSWIERCKKELEQGIKSAFCAYVSDKIVGNIIFQRHKEDNTILEIKNFRVLLKFQNQGVGSKLLLEVENFAKREKFKRMQIDTHDDNLQLIDFLKKKGFKIDGEAYLYTNSQVEVILSKWII